MIGTIKLVWVCAYHCIMAVSTDILVEDIESWNSFVLPCVTLATSKSLIIQLLCLWGTVEGLLFKIRKCSVKCVCVCVYTPEKV